MKKVTLSRHRESGISLLELLIAVVAAGIVLVLANGVLVNFQKESQGQRRLAQGQSELHSAKISIEKNLRRVGRNIPRVSRIRLSASSFPTRQAIYIGNNPSGPDTLVIRGNFDTAISQLRSPLANNLSTSNLTLLVGTAKFFAVNDYIVLQSNDWNEYTQITAVNVAGGTIQTKTRLNPSYQAGTTVKRVLTYTYFVATDSSLQVIGPQGTAKLLDDHVKDLSFSLLSYGKKKFQTKSLAIDSSVDTAEYAQYSFTVRIPKQKGLFLDRTISGEVYWRN